MSSKVVWFALVALAIAVMATEGGVVEKGGPSENKPTPEPQTPQQKAAAKQEAERERYSRHYKARLNAELDVVHDMLLKDGVTFQRDPADKKLFLKKYGPPHTPENLTGRPLSARTDEDGLLRELKETNAVLRAKDSGKNEGQTEDYQWGKHRQGAPLTLDPKTEETNRNLQYLKDNAPVYPVDLEDGSVSDKSRVTNEHPYNIIHAKKIAAAKAARDMTAGIAAHNAEQAHLQPAQTQAPSKVTDLRQEEQLATLSLAERSSVLANKEESDDSNTPVLAANLQADDGLQLPNDHESFVYSFFSEVYRDHYYTTDGELFPGVAKWSGKSKVGRLYSAQVSGSVPLYVFWNQAREDHRLSIKKDIGVTGYTNVGTLGYVYATQVPGSVPLYEFHDKSSDDHMYTTSPKQFEAREKSGTVSFSNAICYVLPVDPQTHTMSQQAMLEQIAKMTDSLLQEEDVDGSPAVDMNSVMAQPNARDTSNMDKMKTDPSNPTATVPQAATKAGNGNGNEATESMSAAAEPELSEEWASATNKLQKYRKHVYVDDSENDLTRGDAPEVVPVYEYYNLYLKDHYYTARYSVLGGGKGDWTIKGAKFWVWNSFESGSVPLYRYWNVKKGDHYYTLQKFKSESYRFQGIAGYVYATPKKDTVPLYRYYNKKAGDHFYTLKRNDADLARRFYDYQGIQAYVFNGAREQLLPQDTEAHNQNLVDMHRYFNDRTHHHFYTTSTEELSGNLLAHGWQAEGVTCRIHPRQSAGMAPLHRYFNLRTLDHYFTTKQVQLKDGWTYDGVQGFVYKTMVKGTVPLYRYYNAKLNDDIFTTHTSEIEERADRGDWLFKGITAYVYPAASQYPTNVYQYYNKDTDDYYYTTNYEIFKAGREGWVLQGTPFAAYSEGQRGTVPLHQYYHPQKYDHMYTTKFFPDGKDGWKYEGIAMYVYANKYNKNAVRLYRFFNPKMNTHYYTTNPNEATQVKPGMYHLKDQSGWFYYGVQAYVENAVASATGNNELAPVTSYFDSRHRTHIYAAGGQKFASSSVASRGVTFRAFVNAGTGRVPIHHYYNKANGANWYSDVRLTGAELAKRGTYSGLSFYIYAKSARNSVPCYLYTSATDSVLSVTPHNNNNNGGKITIDGVSGYKFSGIIGYVMPPHDLTGGNSPRVVFQYYKSSTKEHWYTMDFSLIGTARKGWGLEGTPFRAWPAESKGHVAVYDHFNPSTNTHQFSLSKSKIANHKDPRVLFYVSSNPGKDLQPLYPYTNAKTSDTILVADPSTVVNGVYEKISGWTRSKSVLGYVLKPEQELGEVPPPSTSRPVYSIERTGDAQKLTLSKPKSGGQALFYTFPTEAEHTVPMFEYYNEASKDRLYTTKYFKPGTMGFTGGDIAFYVRHTRGQGTRPLYRFYNKTQKKHLYVLSLKSFIEQKDGSYRVSGSSDKWSYQGVSAFVYVMPQERSEVHQWYNPKTKSHRYTTATKVERGWTDQGAHFFAYTGPRVGTQAVNEYVNSKSGERQITFKNFARLAAGFTRSAKPAFYTFTSHTPGTLPLFRFWNEQLQDNLYTTNVNNMVPTTTPGRFKNLEDNTTGWKKEGIVAYVYTRPSARQLKQ
eukprot:TRINITY_DN361_c0_g1_i2.p1 TRINITY_DN361_c0_g1~~TRINITY_DN361_c0_g1_i2.p1  ORF type:complete len:1592 (+),score=590.68 TRINITY_DN361_c0_g1_i2:243-5018(+)